jgi:predicted O-methyltransferase YrrM
MSGRLMNKKVCKFAESLGKRGLHSDSEVLYFYRLPTKLGDGEYANLGTFYGLSTAALCAGIKDAGIDGHVDSFDTFSAKALRARKLHPQEPLSLEEVEKSLVEMGLGEVCTLYKGYFSDSIKKVQNKRYNFIFVDGSHDYESVKEDFANWSPLLKVGGEIAFHDTHKNSTKTQVWRLMEELETQPDKWKRVATMVWKKLK